MGQVFHCQREIIILTRILVWNLGLAIRRTKTRQITPRVLCNIKYIHIFRNGPETSKMAAGGASDGSTPPWRHSRGTQMISLVKCYLPGGASVGDSLKMCPWVATRVDFSLLTRDHPSLHSRLWFEVWAFRRGSYTPLRSKRSTPRPLDPPFLEWISSRRVCPINNWVHPFEQFLPDAVSQ